MVLNFSLPFYSPSEKVTIRLFDSIAICLSVLLLLSAGVSNYSLLHASSNQANALLQFESDLERAQQAALSEAARTTISLNSSKTGYSVSLNGENPRNIVDRVLFFTGLPRGITLELSNSLIFDSRGQLINPVGQPAQTLVMFLEHDKPYAQGTILGAGHLQLK